MSAETPVLTEHDLVAHHTVYCTHLRNTILLATNTAVGKLEKYTYSSTESRFVEVECHICQLDTAQQLSPREIVMVTTSAGIRRALVVSVDDDGRVVRQRFDDDERKFVPMEPSPIKKLATKTPFFDNFIRPFYSTLCPPFETSVIIGENSLTGELGQFVVHPNTQQLIQVLIADLVYDHARIEKMRPQMLGNRQALFLGATIPGNTPLMMAKNAEGFLEKLIHDRDNCKYAVLPPQLVITQETAIWSNYEDPDPLTRRATIEQLKAFVACAAENVIIDKRGCLRGTNEKVTVEMGKLTLDDNNDKEAETDKEEEKTDPINDSDDEDLEIVQAPTDSEAEDSDADSFEMVSDTDIDKEDV